jgi:hypothetical protein
MSSTNNLTLFVPLAIIHFNSYTYLNYLIFIENCYRRSTTLLSPSRLQAWSLSVDPNLTVNGPASHERPGGISRQRRSSGDLSSAWGFERAQGSLDILLCERT